MNKTILTDPKTPQLMSNEELYRGLELRSPMSEHELSQIELEIQNRELKEAYKLLEESHASYLELFEEAPVGFLILDLQGRVKKSNAFAEGIFQQKIEGLHLGRLLHEDSRPVFSNHLALCSRAHEKSRLQCELTLKAQAGGKTKTLQINSTMFKHQIRIALTDHSETVRAEALDRLTKNLTAEKALREHFVSTLSHDLRAPLTSSKLCAELLLANVKDASPQVKRLFELQIEELSRADRMIKELLDANKVEDRETVPLAMKNCDLTKIARQTIEILCSVYKKRVTFDFTAQGDVSGYWSKDGLQRILENLLINAIKYGDNERPISVSLEERGNFVSMKVHNFGNPIDPSNQEKIFEACHRIEDSLTSPTQGWGLGLNLVRTLVQKHDGKISLESTLKTGTVFEVILPKKAPANIRKASLSS